MRLRDTSIRRLDWLLTWIPPVSVIVLVLFAILVLRLSEERQIRTEVLFETHRHHQTLEAHLDRFVRRVRYRIDSTLADVRATLKKSVYLFEGYRAAYPNASRDEQDAFLRQIERREGVQMVVSDRNLSILYGVQQLQYIERLIFNRPDNPTYRRITLQYIASQGSPLSQSWRDDIHGTIQMSFFERLDSGEMLGAFSQVSTLRNVMRSALIDAVQNVDIAPKGYYFWLYDPLKKRVFNYRHLGQWQTLDSLDPHATTHPIDRLFLTVGVGTYDEPLEEALSLIRSRYRDKKTAALIIIMLFGIVMGTFAWLFPRYVRRVLRRYHLQTQRTSRNLRRLKERYELAILASNDGLWDTDLTTGTTHFSKQWLAISGYSREDIPSFDAWTELLHPEDRERIVRLCQEHKSTPHTEAMMSEYRLRTRAGTYRWMLGRGRVFWDETGRPVRALMLSTDIDRQKQASEHLKQLVEEEVAKNQEKQKLLIQQNKLAAMGEMIGSIAHQWRQPLNNITLILHFIRDNIDNDAFTREMLAQYVQRAKKQIDFMSDTIDDFRSFYHPSKTKAPFDAAEAVDSTLGIMRTQLEKAGIAVSLSGATFTIMGYENEFRQAILNILANAKDAIVQKQARNAAFRGEIRVVFGTNRITLYNNGGNVSLEVLERMFEPYFTTKFENQGTGIGLYMTRTIIENNMGGTLTAKNRGDGIEFTIQFYPEKPSKEKSV